MPNHIKIYGVKPRIQYVADGNLKQYEFPFAIFQTSDIDVYLDDKLQEQSAFTVSASPDTQGGAVIFETAPANGIIISIVRNLSIERTTDFQEGGVLRAKVLNDEFDYQTACLQQVADNLNRSMVLPPYATETDVDLTLPTPSAGKAIVWNKDGTNLENSAVKINELESTLRAYKESAENASTEATTQAEIASEKADIATAKADIASEKAQETISTLASKANKDMDNLTEAGKNLITGFGMPDYTAGISIANNETFTAPCDGVYVGSSSSNSLGSNSMVEVALYDENNNLTFILGNRYYVDSRQGPSGIMTLVPHNYKIKIMALAGNINISAFYPLKGSKND